MSISGQLVKRGLGLIALVVAGVLVALLVGFYSENRNNHLTLAGLFAAHTMLYVLAFQVFGVWGGVWFLPISIAEYPILLLALHWHGYGEDGPTTNRRAPRRR